MSGLSAVSSQGGAESVISPPGALINGLPDEVLALIFGHTEKQDRVHCELVCRRWRQCCIQSLQLHHKKIEQIARKIDRLSGLLRDHRADDVSDIRGWRLRKALSTSREALIRSVYELVRERDLENSLVVDGRFTPLIELAQKLSNVKDQVLGCVVKGISQAGNSALAIEAAKHISDHTKKNAAFQIIVKNLSETVNFHLMLGVLDEDEFTSESSRSWARFSIAEAAMKVGDFALAMQQVACMSEEGERDLLLKDQARTSIIEKAAEAGLFRVAIAQAKAISSDNWEKSDSFLVIAEAAGATGKLDLAVNMLSEASKHHRFFPLDEIKNRVIREFVKGAGIAKIIRQLGKIADKEVALAVVRDLIELNRESDAAEVVRSIASWRR